MTDKINFPKITIEKEIPNETLEQIRQIAPNVLEDGKVNCKKLNEAIGEMLVDPDEPEHFGLNWPGKRQSIKLARTPSKQTLIPVPGDGVDEDKTQNLFIEGENMEVLKLLQKSYSGRIKIIYIDPPYNTGNDFIYKDKFAESEKNFLESTGQINEEGNDMVANKKSSGRFHTNWLNMIYPRLKLAKELLTDDGVIFVSIDDNEVHNLREIMNEIFGEENCLGQIIWRNKSGGGKQGIDLGAKEEAKKKEPFVTDHEYVIVFTKNVGSVNQFQLPLSKKEVAKYKNLDNDKTGPYKLKDLEQSIPGERGNNYYPIIDPDGIEIKPKGGRYKWRYVESSYKEEFRLGHIFWKKIVCSPTIDQRNYYFRPMTKQYLYINGTMRYKTMRSIWHKLSYTKDGSQELRKLFELPKNSKDVFDNPKPVKLIKRIIYGVGFKKNDIVLDFFAGSGTSAHATIELNALFKMNREFICIQLPEPTKEGDEAFKLGYKNIAEITKERIRRAGKKIKEDTKAEIDYGFKVFKLQKESNLKDESEMFGMTDQLTLESAEENLSSLRKDWTKEKLLTEILLIEGFPLTSTIEKAPITTNEVLIVTSSFEDRPDKLVVCLDPEINTATIDNLPVGELDNFIFLESSLPEVGGDEIKQILYERFKSRIKVI